MPNLTSYSRAWSRPFCSRTRSRVRGLYNRDCWWAGRRLDWVEWARGRPFEKTWAMMDGRSLKALEYIGHSPAVVWLEKPRAGHKRRGFFRKWKRDGTYPAGSD